MERLNENKIICHIIGLNQDDKENLNKLSALSDQDSIIDSFNDLSNMVLYSDLKEQVVHSAINIAYSDYEYHPNEKQLIDILKNKWSD